MPDYPEFIFDLPMSVISNWDNRISPAADFSKLFRLGATATAAWPVASKAILFPITVSRPVTVTKMATLNGATVSGNVDVGIYDTNYARLVSAGGVAQAGASVPQIFDVTDTALSPGDYFLAMVADNATGLYQRASPQFQALTCVGCVQMATAYPLPTTITPAVMSSGYMPYIAALISGTVI